MRLDRLFTLREHEPPSGRSSRRGLTTFLTGLAAPPRALVALPDSGGPIGQLDIAGGLSLGILHPRGPGELLAGRGREVSALVWVLAALFVLRYAYLGSE